MTTRKILIAVIVGTFIGVDVFIWLSFHKNVSTFLPSAPANTPVIRSQNMSMMFPVFIAKDEQITDVQWHLNYFQPRLDGLETKNKATYLNISYIDASGVTRHMLVFAGGEMQNTQVEYVSSPPFVKTVV